MAHVLFLTLPVAFQHLSDVALIKIARGNGLFAQEAVIHQWLHGGAKPMSDGVCKPFLLAIDHIMWWPLRFYLQP